MQPARPTIQDVARGADVKVSTVSRVLNGYPDVAKATRARVLETIERLNYVPSRTQLEVSAQVVRKPCRSCCR